MTPIPTLPRISDYAAYHAARAAGAQAMTVAGRSWTYEQLSAAVDELARALLAAGVRKGDRVATLQTPHPDYFIAFLATASIGGIWVGLHPKHRIEELRHIVSDCEPCVLLTRTRIDRREYGDEIRALSDACAGLREVVVFEGEQPNALPQTPGCSMQTMASFLRRGGSVSDTTLAAARQACGHRDPCLIVYTSGSTGCPKGAVLHHQGIVNFSLGQNALWPVEPLRVVNYFPINHLGCVVDVSTPCLTAGGCLLFLEQFDPVDCLELMVRERASLWASVPSVFQMQLALPQFDQFDLAALQLIVWEGATMPVPVLEKLLTFGPALATNYGMTETTSAITALEPTRDLELLSNTVGRPFPGAEVRLVRADGGEAAVGEAGEVWVRSDNNLVGYWGRPSGDDVFSPEGYFKTGDLALRRADGRLQIAGRIKEMFKSGGYNVYPLEIEAALQAHPSVAMVAVVAAAHPLWQEAGMAFVVARSPVTEHELAHWCQQRLANYKIPKRFVVQPQLPLLPVGKVDKMALRQLAAQLGWADAAH